MPTPNASTATTATTPSGNGAVDALIGTMRWADAEISYSFASSSLNWFTGTGGYGASTGSGEPWNGFAALNANQQSAVQDALEAWSAASGVSFVQLTESASSVGTLRFAFSTGGGLGSNQAQGYQPGSGPKAGDVWFNTGGTSYGAPAWAKGSWEYVTALHEIGHALGLRHPFEGPNAIAPALDSRSYTVMSYSAAPGNTGTWFNFEPTTPMVLDIAAIRQLYGADTSTNAGNTVYSFTATGLYHQTLVDAGGIDTITYSAAGSGRIDLNAGVSGGSRLGEAIYIQDAGLNNLGRVHNIWIAEGSVIENAIGGNGNDTLIGNAVANQLSGGVGNDSLIGGAGNDRLDGEGGRDTMSGGDGSDTYLIDDALDVVTESGTVASSADRVSSSIDWTLDRSGALLIEQLVLTGTALAGTGNALANTITGNDAANTLTGGSGNDTLGGGLGNDTLTGGTGNDYLSGGTGADQMAGGDGSDTYRVDNALDLVDETGNLDSALDTVLSSVTWSLASAGNLVVERLILDGTAAINGTGNGLANSLGGNGAANRLDGGDGNDTVNGGAGNDTITGGAGNDSLIGGIGIDSLAGGEGGDVYRVDNVLDLVNEAGGQTGTADTVFSTVNWSLGAAGNLLIENLTLEGTAALNGSGNALANALTGNAGANRLFAGGGNDSVSGGLGDDLLAGGSGSDRLTGGAGRDAFVFDSATGADTITDFVSRTDSLRIQMSAVGIGDRDAIVEGAAVRSAPGGFSNLAELVIFSSNAASLSTAAAAAAIGSANAAFSVGRTALFVVDNGVDTGVYRFTSSAANAQVSAGELVLLVTLAGTTTVATADFLFTP